MKRILGPFILFLIFVSLPVVRSECGWTGAIFSEGTCFLYDKGALSYSEANNYCQSKGGVLAKVTSKTQLNDVSVQVPEDSDMWIGAHYNPSKGHWVWADDNTAATELSLFWAASQPASETSEYCVEIFVSPSGQQRAYSNVCSTTYPFLCMEKALITTQDTTLVTSTDPMISSTPLTTITDNTTTETLMKCGANSFEFNVLLLFNICVLKYLIF
ncbi:unnamed protein product [Lymnaea stagnalis]|uniref:C-type lectin domain-containing protein n=1 Tax=Lymnaea stagnalis TaxID=6523 RepID=A0AAV2HD04_LYMST